MDPVNPGAEPHTGASDDERTIYWIGCPYGDDWECLVDCAKRISYGGYFSKHGQLFTIEKYGRLQQARAPRAPMGYEVVKPKGDTDNSGKTVN